MFYMWTQCFCDPKTKQNKKTQATQDCFTVKLQASPRFLMLLRHSFQMY